MRLKFWDKPQKKEPAIPDDITHFNEVEPYYRNHLGATDDSTATKAVAVAAAIVVLSAVAIFLWLYFGEFLFNNHT